MSEAGTELSVWLDRCVPEMTYDEAVAYVVACFCGHPVEVPPDVWDALRKRAPAWIAYGGLDRPVRKFVRVVFDVGAPITVFQAERGLS